MGCWHVSSACVVCSRHPGRNPKLEGFTLSYPAFKPLTEHHASSTGLLNTSEVVFDTLGAETMLSVCIAATTSQSEPRASDVMDFTSGTSSIQTPNRIKSGINRSPMFVAPRRFFADMSNLLGATLKQSAALRRWTFLLSLGCRCKKKTIQR